MDSRVRTFVWAVVAAACVSAGVVALRLPEFGRGFGAAVLALGSIGILAQLLGFTLPRSQGGSAAGGSVSFVPFLAMCAVAPSVASVCGAFVVACVGQAARPRTTSPLKRIFNVAQQVVAISLGILAYHAVGGRSMLSTTSLPYWPLAVLFIVFLGVNHCLVAGAVAISEHRGFGEVWAATALGTLPYDLLSLPVIVSLAWVYAHFGVAGAVSVSVPILGLRQLYKVNSDLERSNQELLELMVAAIEARDPYTSGHSRRVSQNAKVIAQILGLRHSEVRRVEIAALLHDVGKIHEIFASILQKPGRLTEEENAIMQTHPIKSEELVRRVTQLRDIVPAVRHHHENWDGTGYPDGLAGERIPLAARIIIFADTIDAMTSDRPYRKALDAIAVRSELAKWRARQFDPKICDALLSSSRFGELFVHSPHQSLPHTQEIPRLRLADRR